MLNEFKNKNANITENTLLLWVLMKTYFTIDMTLSNITVAIKPNC